MNLDNSKDAGRCLIGPDGQPQYGRHPNAIRNINFLDFDFRSPMDRPRSLRAKKRRWNQFQFIACDLDTCFIGAGIVHLGIASYAFVYCYHKLSGQCLEERFIQPLGRKTRTGTSPTDSIFAFQKGGASLKVTPDKAFRHLAINLPGKLLANIALVEAEHIPLSVCSRAGYDGWVYTSKKAGVVANADLDCPSLNINMSNTPGLATIDWSAGLMRRETFWNWASVTGQTGEHRYGLNIAAGVNETGTNENGLWWRNKLFSLPNVLFEFDRYQPLKPWRMYSEDGSVDLTFTPLMPRQERMHLGIVASNFRQVLGQFQGRIQIEKEILPIANAWGLAEDHYAKW